MIEDLVLIIILSLIVCSISFTVTNNVLFETLREFLTNIPFIGKLINCYFCFSHWVALALVIGYDAHISFMKSNFFIDWVMISFAITWGSYLFYSMFNFLLEGSIDSNDHQTPVENTTS